MNSGTGDRAVKITWFYPCDIYNLEESFLTNNYKYENVTSKHGVFKRQAKPYFLNFFPSM